MRKLKIALILLALASMSESGWCLMSILGGPQTNAPDRIAYPRGLVALMRHPSRVIEVGYNSGDDYYFQATPEQLNELLDEFGKTRMRDHEVSIEPGAGPTNAVAGGLPDYNASLEITDGLGVPVVRTNTLEPRLVLYVGKDRSVLRQLKIPDDVIVQCDVPGASIRSKAVQPARDSWYGVLHFDDATPVANPAFSCSVTLWQKNSPDGIPMGQIGYQGRYGNVFSDAEMADLKSGKSWLTVTVGNFATVPKRDDPLLPVGSLAKSLADAKPFTLPAPKLYYGRVLFEDGSPAIVAGGGPRGVFVNVPYAGLAWLDDQGCFKVFLEPEQFEKLKTQNSPADIMVPEPNGHNFAARAKFPAELLSLDRSNAGAVKIPKPAY
jgi:hypothetical protein